MSKTALLDAIRRLDLVAVRRILARQPALASLRSDRGLDLLQLCCQRSTAGDRTGARRQLQLARWLVDQGFDPLATQATAPGEDGEDEPAHVSLAWFAVARAQNVELARYFLELGAAPGALFAAAWWGTWEIVEDLVDHGANLDEVVGATPLHMAVEVLYRGVDGKPERARRRMKLLKELLRLGADPNIAATNGDTPLHMALAKGYDVGVVRLLLRHGADPDRPGKTGHSVREIAARKKDRRYAAAIATATR